MRMVGKRGRVGAKRKSVWLHVCYGGWDNALGSAAKTATTLSPEESLRKGLDNPEMFRELPGNRAILEEAPGLGRVEVVARKLSTSNNSGVKTITASDVNRANVIIHDPVIVMDNEHVLDRVFNRAPSQRKIFCGAIDRHRRRGTLVTDDVRREEMIKLIGR